MSKHQKFVINNIDKILRNKFKTKSIKNIQVNLKSIEASGLMSQILEIFAVAEIDEKITKTVILMKVDKEGKLGDMAHEQMAFEKEIFVYTILRKLFSKIEDQNFIFDLMPECYLSDESGILVLEDFRQNDYSVLPIGSGMDFDHITLGLKALAKFHAASIMYEEKMKKQLQNNCFSLHEMYAEAFQEPIFKKNETCLGYKWYKTFLNTVENLIELTRREESRFLIRILREESEKVFEIVKPSKQFRNVICHGDPWLLNFLFKYKNGLPIDCKLIDFQCVRYLPPVFDVLVFLYYSCQKPIVRESSEKVIDLYYEELSKIFEANGKNLEEIISREEYQKSVDYFHIQVTIIAACANQHGCLITLDPNTLNTEGFLEKYMYEGNSEIVLNAYKNSKQFKYFMDTILDKLCNNLSSC